jgi:hypothetical protein
VPLPFSFICAYQKSSVQDIAGENMVHGLCPTIALFLFALLTDGSLGKPQICRQYNPIADIQWRAGDKFAYCALKDGQATFTQFAMNFVQKFITDAATESGFSTGAHVGHRETLRSLNSTLSSWISNGICHQSTFAKFKAQPCFKSSTPLFLHLSGPSGVGKTLFTNLLSSMLFKERRKDEQDPQLDIHHCGQSIHQLSRLEHDVDLMDLLQTMHDQLLHCPFSVFVFENVQLANKSLLRNLFSHLSDGSVPSMQEGDNDEPHSIENAMFIFTSNMGAYNDSQSLEEARNSVKAAVRQHFYDESLKPMSSQTTSASSRILTASSNSGVVNFFERNIVDTTEVFLPLKAKELAKLAELELHRLVQELRRHSSFEDWKGNLICDRNCRAQLVDACFRNQYDCKSRMAYGLKQFLTDELFSSMFRLKFSHEHKHFNDSNMQLVIENDGVQLVPVRIQPQSKGAKTSKAANPTADL